MKKIIVIFLAAIMLMTVLAVPAMAAGNCYVAGPNEVRAGDTITVTFCAGGGIYGGIYGGSGSMSFDSTQVTSWSYTSLLDSNWTVEFTDNAFVFSDNSMANPLREATPIFSATFLVSNEVEIGTPITITASNVMLKDGEQDVAMGNPSWSRRVEKQLNNNNTLAELSVEGFLLSPVFTPEQMDYTVYLPNEVESIQITAAVADEKAMLELPTIENIPVGKTTYEVRVIAENGDIRLYTITTFRAEPFEGPYTPEETEPVTEPTEPATEPTTEPATEPTTEPETEPTAGQTTEPTATQSGPQLSKKMVGLLWVVSIVAAFLGGFIAPMLLWNRE